MATDFYRLTFPGDTQFPTLRHDLIDTLQRKQIRRTEKNLVL